jgi:hypothetical protein
MSSEFQKQVDPVITSFPMRLVVAVVVVIIILMFVAKLFNMGAERFTGSGVQDRVFTSGATMRVLSQSLSATNQEDRQTISNSEIKEAIPTPTSSRSVMSSPLTRAPRSTHPILTAPATPAPPTPPDRPSA